MKRPEKKYADTKVTDEDILYFSLGIDREEFILPSQRKNYLSDKRAVALVKAVQAGEDLSGQDFSGINLKGADISGGKFQGSNFSKALLCDTKAVGCNFFNADFSEAFIARTDFSNANLRGISYKRLFARDNDFSGAILDTDAVHFLTELEKIVVLIEQGKLDMRTLSKDDLLGLDIRRIDFTNIDLEDLDLSVFALDGINLCGTYIDPKQLMSAAGLREYYIDVQKTKEKSRRELERVLLKEKEEQLNTYGQQQLKNVGNKKIKTKQDKIKKAKVKINPEKKPTKKFEPKVIIAAPREGKEEDLNKTKEIKNSLNFSRINDKIKVQKSVSTTPKMQPEERPETTNGIPEASIDLEQQAELKNNIQQEKNTLEKEASQEETVQPKNKKADSETADDTDKVLTLRPSFVGLIKSHLPAFKIAGKLPKAKKVRFKIKG